jgi:hypothetical protein
MIIIKSIISCFKQVLKDLIEQAVRGNFFSPEFIFLSTWNDTKSFLELLSKKNLPIIFSVNLEINSSSIFLK